MMARPKIKVVVAERVTIDTSRDELVVLAAEIGCSVSTVRHWARVLGLRPTPLEGLPRIGTVLDYLRAGDTPRRIGRRHGVTHQAVYRCLKRNGYQLLRGVVFKIERNAA